jgi:hypothetical protein
LANRALYPELIGAPHRIVCLVASIPESIRFHLISAKQQNGKAVCGIVVPNLYRMSHFTMTVLNGDGTRRR